MTVDQVRERMGQGASVLFLDVRNPKAWASSDEKIPGAIRMTLDELPARAEEIERTGALVVAYCT